MRESADDQHPVGRSELGERQRLEASEQLSDWTDPRHNERSSQIQTGMR